MDDAGHRGDRRVVLALGCLLLALSIVALHYLTGNKDHWQPWSTFGAAVATILIGVAVIRALVAAAAARSEDYLGAGRVRSMRSLIAGVLYVVLVLTVASQTEIDLSGIALSGAVTGVVVGIAAQSSLANIIAGLVILFARPLRPGQFVTVRASAFAGSEYSGVVGEITLFYTTLLTGTQEIRVPNSAMVTSVVTLRPRLIDVYVPVILSASQWQHASTTDLSQSLTSKLPPGRTVLVQVERMEGCNVQLGVRVSVATEEERSLFEQALAAAVAQLSPACAPDSNGLMQAHAGTEAASSEREA
jgi:hypothetical protein